VPQLANPSSTLEALLKLTQRPEQAVLRHQLAEAALERFPGVSATKAALAADLIGALEGKRLPELCQGERRAACIDRVSQLTVQLGQALPRSSLSLELRAQLMLATGRAPEAEALLARECERFNPNRSCVKLRLAAATRARSAEGIAVAARTLIATGCETPAACAASFENLGDEMLGSGNTRLALRHYARAAKEEPSLARWLKLADAASSVGAHLQAVDALTHALREKGHDPELEERIRSERSRAFRQQLTGVGARNESTN
jgi:hypothetical protein